MRLFVVIGLFSFCSVLFATAKPKIVKELCGVDDKLQICVATAKRVWKEGDTIKDVDSREFLILRAAKGTEFYIPVLSSVQPSPGGDSPVVANYVGEAAGPDLHHDRFGEPSVHKYTLITTTVRENGKYRTTAELRLDDVLHQIDIPLSNVKQ